MILSKMFIHAALLSSTYIVLANANANDGIRSEHSLLVMAWLGTHGPDTSDRDETIPEKCLAEISEFDDINNFLNGLLDDDEHDDVTYDDYDNYEDSVSCTQNESTNDVLCDWEDFFTADTKYNCEQGGGVFHSLMVTENCTYNSIDEEGAIELRSIHKNIFVCIGRSCELPDIIRKLSRDIMAAYGPTSCTASYSGDE